MQSHLFVQNEKFEHQNQTQKRLKSPPMTGKSISDVGSHNTRAADSVVQALEARIHSGGLSTGAALPPERDLMAEFGVSRTVVREAVQVLSARGLLDARPRHRPVVRKPSVETAFDAVEGIVGHLLSEKGGVKNLFDIRIMVEASLAREAALKAKTCHLEALAAALKANEAAIEDSALFYETDIAFHDVLYDIPGNPVLPAIQRAYTGWLAPHWRQMPRLPERNRKNAQAHRAIFEAILMRDADAAESALRAHMGDAWAQVRATFGDI